MELWLILTIALQWFDTNRYKPISRRPKPFRFEEVWVGEEECSRIINDIWAYDSNDDSIEGVML